MRIAAVISAILVAILVAVGVALAVYRQAGAKEQAMIAVHEARAQAENQAADIEEFPIELANDANTPPIGSWCTIHLRPAAATDGNRELSGELKVVNG